VPLFSKAQTDDLFWFAAPEISVNWANFDAPIVLRITSYENPADVTISQPAGGGMPQQNVSLLANSSQTVDLTPWLGIIENQPANTILNYGLKITSTSDVTIYYEVVSSECQCNPEIFVLKGRNALGTDFFVPMQNFLDNNPVYNPVPFSAFEIVATEDNTIVSITPTADIVGHPAGITFNVALNEGQTYSATATSGLAADHLMGSRVTSNNPIAITYKDDLLNGGILGPCSDLGGDQIVPIEILGTEYIAVNGFLNAPGDQLFIMGTEANTDISFNGAPLATIGPGETYAVAVGGQSAYVEATAPVSVLQLSGFGCEVGLDIIPPIICTGSTSISFTRSTVESLYITLLVESGNEDDFLFNGNSGVITAAMFNPVPGTGGQWLVATTLFSLADTPIGTASLVSNTAGVFHLGFIHGGAMSGCRFGYFSNFANIEVNAEATANTVCEGETIELFCNDINDAIFVWQGPEGFNSADQNPEIINAASLMSGEYAVTVEIPGCETAYDTVSIQINEPSFALEEVAICSGESYQLPDGTNVSNAGSYESVLLNQWNCDSTITTNLTVYNTEFTISDDVNICAGQSAQLEVSGGIDWTWSPAAGLNNPNVSNPIASPDETTSYEVEITFDNGCVELSEVIVTVGELPFTVLTENAICDSAGSIEVSDPGGVAPFLYTVNGLTQDQAIFTDLPEGLYNILVVDSEACSGEQEILLMNDAYTLDYTVEILNAICLSLGSLEIVPGTNAVFPVNLEVNGNSQSDLWVEDLTPGIYGIELSDANGCTGISVEEIEPESGGLAQFNADPTSGEPPLSVIFTNTSVGLNEFVWDFGNGETMNTLDAFHVFEVSGDYNVQLLGTDTVYGCVDSASIVIYVDIPFSFYVPNSFTPDGDDVNEVFKPLGISFDQSSYVFRIFDRWGQLIFETTDFDQAWTGNVLGGGHFAANGVYNWIIQVRPLDSIEDKIFRGTVMLIR
jgi:gliding motility-associated-like protein